MVFHGNVGIRKALRCCQQDARRPSRMSSSRFPSLTPTFLDEPCCVHKALTMFSPFHCPYSIAVKGVLKGSFPTFLSQGVRGKGGRERSGTYVHTHMRIKSCLLSRTLSSSSARSLSLSLTHIQLGPVWFWHDRVPDGFTVCCTG